MDKINLGLLLLGAFTVSGCSVAQTNVPAADGAKAADWTNASDVIWNTPSKDSSGSMPLGNGEVGMNLWVEENGDLLFLISRIDAFSESGRILKVGKMRVSLSPNPFGGGAPFRQHLKLRDGVCEIVAGRGVGQVTLRVFVDANQPVIHVAGTSSSPLRVTARVESWREQPHTLAKGEEEGSSWSLSKAPFPLTESADVFPAAARDAVSWYHRNETSESYDSTMKLQSLEAFSQLAPNPLLQRTFGGWVTGEGFQSTDNRTLATTAPTRAFDLRVAALSLQAKSVDEWTAASKKVAAASSDAKAAQTRTADWWNAFWDRSHVVVQGDQSIEIPGGAHPLRVGYDSQKQSNFPGQIGRTSVYSRALSQAEITQLANAQNGNDAPVKAGLIESGDGTPREIANDNLPFKRGLTLEAWINTNGTIDGRIFDKVTAGKGDGFLLDTYPKDTLRFVFGEKVVNAPAGSLIANARQHAAATVDAATGAIRLYLNGQIVARDEAVNTRISLTQALTLQRYMQACAARGTYPIKFNGSLFTVEPTPLSKPFNADWRQWGEMQWFQNLRLIYHPMLASGDSDMMEPFFRFYENVRPLAEARTKLYHGVEGATFPETMTLWGTYGNSDYGWDRTGKQPKDVDSLYIKNMAHEGPELLALMLDRWDYTGDERFLKEKILPMAVSVLKYFDTRFKKDADGKIIIDPTQVMETYWHGVVNDMPTVAGVVTITSRLSELPGKLTTPEQRAFFARMKAAAPPLPTEEVEVDGQKKRVLAAAQKYTPPRTNVELPELYAVWPFRLYGLGKPDIEAARVAYERRIDRIDFGWAYDSNMAAILGLTDEAARITTARLANSNPAYRWPVSWGPNFDWLPDQDHGSNLMLTTQLMLLQGVGNRIFVLPAWPKNWDVNFKLHAPQQTVVECVYRGGKIESLVVTPASRRKDVVLPQGIGE